MENIETLNRLSGVLTENPENFILKKEELKDAALQSCSILFGLARNAYDIEIDTLCIDEMDVEQIWAQIDLANVAFMNYFNESLDVLVNQSSDDEEEVEEEEYEEEESDNVMLSDLDGEFEFDNEQKGKDEDYNESTDEDFKDLPDQEISGSEEEVASESGDFFSVQELENFADGDLNTSELADVDFMKDIDDEAEEEEDEANIMYSDFFGSSKGSREIKSKKTNYSKNDRNNFEPVSEITSDLKKQLLVDVEDEGDEDLDLTRFQKKQKEMAKVIHELEDELIGEKPWQLKGEVNVKARPENSLLQENLEFEFASKPVPVVTEDFTTSIEQIIQQRIIDSAYDDVQRRQAPITDAVKDREPVEVDDKKPSKSLAKVYEDEYKAEKDKAENREKTQEELPQHKEIQTMFNDLCYKLDALSNWHFTPCRQAMEMNIKSNQ